MEVLRRDSDFQEKTGAFLAQVPLFANFTPEQRYGLAGIMVPKHFKPGAIIQRSDEPVDHMCIVRRGRVMAVGRGLDGEEQAVDFVEQPNFFNELVLSANNDRLPNVTYWAVSRHGATLLELPRQAFERYLEINPSIMDSLRLAAITTRDASSSDGLRPRVFNPR